ncbi:clarin-3-like [Gordionus sp. m RMFG-2023]|uniref:clarin-3-like n=1 Tax=Gordionus sp. m RMFG-2023 TaxID=3053472 RepID=UPI0031FD0221
MSNFIPVKIFFYFELTFCNNSLRCVKPLNVFLISMVKKRRACIFLSFIIGIVSIFLLGLSFGTNYWIISRPIRVVNTPNNSFIYENSKINFGLWRGEKTLDAGFSTEGRTNEIKVIPRYIDTRIFTYELWLSSIVLLIIAMIWAIISVFFALINSIIYPIDKMAGTMGLYLWNALSLAFTFLSTLLFTILYFGDIRQNVLVLEEKRSGFEADGNRTQFGWSYWLMFGAMLCFIINIINIFLSELKCCKKNTQNGSINNDFYLNKYGMYNKDICKPEQTVILY